MKEVNFNDYCWQCKHINVPQDKKPCNECLAVPAREDSHKPINFKQVKIKRGKKR